MNVFEMYYKNGKKIDFWIMRDSWRNVVARVVSIAGFESGPLKGLGRFPYFNDAKESVYAEIYEIIEMENRVVLNQIMPKFGACPDDPKLSIISCPGTYGYRLVSLPGSEIEINKL